MIITFLAEAAAGDWVKPIANAITIIGVAWAIAWAYVNTFE